MDYIYILTCFFAFAIGFILRLIGGGGSILTVPVLVYLMGIDPHHATAYSLFIVGVSSLVASLQNARMKMIDYRLGLVFAFPAFLVIFLVRRLLLPLLPDILYESNFMMIHKDTAIMVFFALVMLISSISMIRGRRDKLDKSNPELNYPLIFCQGIVVGIVTGIVGAGGGFMIIPAMVFFANMEMKRAVATSLMVVAINSLIGFAGDVSSVPLNWPFLLTFTAISVISVTLASPLVQKINSDKLRRIFGWFILCMGIYIIGRELF